MLLLVVDGCFLESFYYYIYNLTDVICLVQLGPGRIGKNFFPFHLFCDDENFKFKAHNYLCVCLLNHILARSSMDWIGYKKKKEKKLEFDTLRLAKIL